MKIIATISPESKTSIPKLKKHMVKMPTIYDSRY